MIRNSVEPAADPAAKSDEPLQDIKTTGKDAAKAVAAAVGQWKKYNGEYAINYSFLDDTFDKLYRSEQRTGQLFNIFAGIAILISCLGLFGLTAYTAQVRTREIGVRKGVRCHCSGRGGVAGERFCQTCVGRDSRGNACCLVYDE